MWWTRKVHRSDEERQEAEQKTEDVRVHVRALTEQLEAAVQRLESIADRMEGKADGSV